MKQLILWLGVVCGLAGCSRHHIRFVFIAPDFQDQYISFLKDASAEGVNLHIDDLSINYESRDDLQCGPMALGCCVHGPDVTPSIFIDRDVWTFSNAVQKKVIMYHELGHCILNRVHRSDKDGMLLPRSIMTPAPEDVIPGWFLFGSDIYLKELFQKGNGP